LVVADVLYFSSSIDSTAAVLSALQKQSGRPGGGR
jgi:hypothetical protein